jgi:hypothetical protein
MGTGGSVAAPDERELGAILRRRARTASLDAQRHARRAAGVQADAAVARSRSRLLRALVRELQREPGHLPARCAWCGRISLGGSFVRFEDVLLGAPPLRLLARATHGICPDCFEREDAAASEERRRRDEPRGGGGRHGR